MSDPQQIERDLRDYLEKEPNLSRKDRLTYLQTIFHKHLEVGKLEHQITYGDLFLIISQAKVSFAKVPFPIHVSGKQLELTEATHLITMESLLSYLNRMKLLKKFVKFDYRD